MARNNPIQALIDQGFYMTSDPTKQPGGFGERKLFSYGKNVDSYCGGLHAAFDLAKYHGAPVKAFVDCTVLQGTGWNGFGWTGVYGFVDHDGIARQFVIGHLQKNPLTFLSIGQKIKKGQIIGHQGTSNTLGVNMASHIHIQFQNYAYLNEWQFICTGLNAYNIDITTSRAIGSSTSTSKAKPKAPAVKPKTGNRGRSLTAYMKGTIDYLGADVRKRTGSQSTGFKWSKRAGYQLSPGALVYVFEVHNGWGRIYTGNKTGHGSNDWIWLGRLQVTKNFK